MSDLQMEELVLKRVGSYIKFQKQYFPEFHRTAEYIEKSRFKGTSGDLLFKTGLRLGYPGILTIVLRISREGHTTISLGNLFLFNSCHGKMMGKSVTPELVKA